MREERLRTEGEIQTAVSDVDIGNRSSDRVAQLIGVVLVDYARLMSHIAELFRN
jgi:hypothetical protein